MAMPIRSIPVLEGEVARRFIKEAKENEKKRGSIKFSEKVERLGTLPFKKELWGSL